MGVFYVDCMIVNPKTPAKRASLKRLLVDTGSEFTWVPSDKLQEAGITVRKRDVPFRMANGQVITRDVGYAIIQADGFETVDEVVFAQPGDMRLLGSRTMEGFGAVVDARRKRIVAAGPHPAASLSATLSPQPDSTAEHARGSPAFRLPRRCLRSRRGAHSDAEFTARHGAK